MNNIKFSVLIPVYNVEKYIRECLDSVLGQSYKNFEVIIVDDGSTDKSGRICDEYAEKYDFIKVIHQKNNGLLYTRRVAIKAATGDFFAFLDSDDWWKTDLLNEAERLIKKHSCDMLMFNHKNIYGNNMIDNKPIFKNETVFENDSKKLLYKMALETDLVNNLCFKIVSRDIVDIEQDYSSFYDVSFSEDALQSASLFVKAQKIVYTGECFYCYRRFVGMTKIVSADNMLHVTKAREKITQIYSAQEFDLTDSIEKEYESYMNDFVKKILYGYLDSPKELKKTCEIVFKTDFYKKATESGYHKLPLYGKVIIRAAEKNKYALIELCSKLLKLKNMLRG